MNIHEPARFKAWQCVGCGRIESQETCLGICQDRPVEVVSAYDFDELLGKNRALAAVLRKLASTTPRAGEWERSYRALQAEARRVLADTR